MWLERESEVVNSQCASIIAAIRQEFLVVIASTASDLADAQRLRYEVYCCEREFEPATPGCETESDEYDGRARHGLIPRRRSGEVIGTVRLVTASADGHDVHFPMQR